MEGSAVEPREGGPWIHADTVRRLLTRAGVNINARNKMENTLLDDAAANGDTSLVAALLAAGSAVDQENGASGPLHAATSSTCGHVGVIRQLLSHGADINSQSKYYNFTPLHCAAMFKCPEALRVLLKAGADANRVDWQGCTPLHHAARFSDEAMNKRLLREANGDPNRVDHKYIETLQCLIDAGCDVNRVNNDGRSPLDEATLYHGRRLSLWVLLRAGATADMDRLKTQRVGSRASVYNYIDKVVAAGGYENLVRTYRQVLTAPRGCVTRYLRQRFGRDAPHDVAVLVLEFWKPPGGP